jgi:hypothetical protein
VPGCTACKTRECSSKNQLGRLSNIVYFMHSATELLGFEI